MKKGLEQMKNNKKQHKISNKMILYFSMITLAISLIFYFLLPSLLNYPPNTINTQFDKEVSIIYYIYQYLIAVFAILMVFAIYFKLKLKKVDIWMKNKKYDLATILSIRKLCLVFPYKLYIVLEILPVLIVTLVLQCTR